MIFDKTYYDSIWGSVHRHDYCDYWAERIISKHGKARVLDAGCGCGFLVKTLRDKGCEAWGIDISDHAIENSCAPQFCLKASVTDIPFKDDFFDVVFSQGLWEYVEEKHVEKSRNEVWRVGKSQLHNIDHDRCDYRPDFVTWKSQEWWDEHLSAPKVLVGCPTHQCKSYSMQQWIDMVKSIDYPNYEILVVDNSPTLDFYLEWQHQIPIFHLNPDPRWDMAQRVASSMEVLRRKFLSEDFYWWWNVESDVIPDPQTLKLLIKHAGDWTGHAFPARGCKEQSSSGIGCSLFSRRLMEDFSFKGSGDCLGKNVDAYFWDWVRPQNKYQVVELLGHVIVEHIREPEGTLYCG